MVWAKAGISSAVITLSLWISFVSVKMYSPKDRRIRKQENLVMHQPAKMNGWKAFVKSRKLSVANVCIRLFFRLLNRLYATSSLNSIVLCGSILFIRETCWFLAIDFDKENWERDVNTFLETCQLQHVPVRLEHSRRQPLLRDQCLYDSRWVVGEGKWLVKKYCPK